jgi:hypothetical protein
MSRGWFGFDLDGTLALYDGWKGAHHIGDPIEPMVALVRTWIAEGRRIKIFTARVADVSPEERLEIEAVIRAWCREHIGQALPVTATKDMAMIALYDDRCVQVEKNTGRLIGGLDHE